jgi:glutamine transport system permease protein
MGHVTKPAPKVACDSIKLPYPPIANQGVLIIKDTSLVATLSVAELTFQARLLADRTAAVYEIFFTLALFYIVLTSSFTGLMRLVERRVRVVQ